MSNVAFLVQPLSQNAEQALKEMINLTRASIEAFEAETNSVALGDDLTFGQISLKKRDANKLYTAAAKEFMARKDEFLRLKSPLLEELKALQAELKSMAKINMSLLEPILPKNNQKGARAK